MELFVFVLLTCYQKVGNFSKLGITNVDKRLKAIKLTLSSMKKITMSDAWRYSTDERDKISGVLR